MKDLEKKLLGLMEGEFSSLKISYNEHALDYSKGRENLEEFYDGWAKFISEEERQEAFESNSVWVLHCHPRTPVGFYCIAASSLEKLLEAAL